MENNIQIFEGKKIRSVWDNEKEEWYFSVVDVVGALTDSVNARDYWYKMKKRMTDEEKSELGDNILRGEGLETVAKNEINRCC